MIVTHTIDECRAHRANLATVAFVPTMGALHEGHLSLMRRAADCADHLAVSIFVNPAQFAPHEDLDRYPRPIERDLELCRAEGVDLVFNPSVDVVYPPGELPVDVNVPALATILEGAARPQFFAGVCRVVAKLFGIVQPDVACFGEKDYQQLRVIEAMTAGLNLPIRIDPCPTIREADGLAMSSRNVYLDAGQRQRARALSRALAEAEQHIAAGEPDPRRIEAAMSEILTAADVRIDYAVVRDPSDLSVLSKVDGRVVCLIAGHVDRVRLIDNRVVEVGQRA